MAVSQIGSWVSSYGGSATGGTPAWTTSPATPTLLGAAPTTDDLVLCIVYNRSLNTGQAGTGSPNALGFNWSASTVTVTSIACTSAASNLGSMEAVYWRANGSINPNFKPVVSTGNNTAVISIGVFRGVDWSTTPIDVVGHLTNPTIDRPPVGTTTGTAPNCDWTGLAMTTTNGGLMFAAIGSASNVAGGWTINGAGTNTQSWAISTDAHAPNGVGGGAELLINTVTLGAGTSTGTVNARTTAAMTLGRSLMFGLRAASGGTTITMPTPPHITFTADPLVVQPVTIQMPTPYIRFQAGTLTVSKHAEAGATLTVPALSAQATGTIPAAGVSAVADFGALVATAGSAHGTGWTSGAAASFGVLSARVQSTGGGSGGSGPTAFGGGAIGSPSIRQG